MTKEEKILEILNNKREIMVKNILYGRGVDYKELLFEIDEEIRKILGDSNEY